LIIVVPGERFRSSQHLTWERLADNADRTQSEGVVPGEDASHGRTKPKPFSWERRMSLSVSLTVNGIQRTIELEDPRVTLLDLLRERLDLTGTKKGCDRGQCGACTVLVDGRRINSCLALAISQHGAEVLTIEGLAQEGACHPVQAAFIAHDAFQCGFCTPGQIMSAVGLIQEGQAGNDPERVREGMSGNLCRCGAYRGITEAVLDAQRSLRPAPQEAA
jgi:xanthine dehydrogenase YagT iron-sulfur-binding subunit